MQVIIGYTCTYYREIVVDVTTVRTITINTIKTLHSCNWTMAYRPSV